MVDVPILCVGRINTPRLAEFVIATGRADLVSMGRALNVDPEMPNKAAEGRLDEIRPCVGCNEGCISAVMKGLPAGCILNTEAGKEIDGPPVPTERPTSAKNQRASLGPPTAQRRRQKEGRGAQRVLGVRSRVSRATGGAGSSRHCRAPRRSWSSAFPFHVRDGALRGLRT